MIKNINVFIGTKSHSVIQSYSHHALNILSKNPISSASD